MIIIKAVYTLNTIFKDADAQVDDGQCRKTNYAFLVN